MPSQAVAQGRSYSGDTNSPVFVDPFTEGPRVELRIGNPTKPGETRYTLLTAEDARSVANALLTAAKLYGTKKRRN